MLYDDIKKSHLLMASNVNTLMAIQQSESLSDGLTHMLLSHGEIYKK